MGKEKHTMKKRVMNLVNFVRGCEPRQPWQDLYTPIKEEIAINKSYGFDHTAVIREVFFTKLIQLRPKF